jgi:hypothetical protein
VYYKCVKFHKNPISPLGGVGNIKGIALLNTNYNATTLESMQNYCKDYYIISRFMYVL